jgi:heat shock protein HtpX
MYRNVTKNKVNTFVIMLVFLAIALGVGWIVYYFTSDLFFLIIIGGFALIYAVVQYFGSAKIAFSVSGAKLADPSQFSELYNSVENISITMGIPTPKVYVINDPAPNAFATGRNPKDGHIAVTSGLLEIMDKRELEGVLSHELSHIKNYDILVATIVFGLVSAISLICDVFLRIAFFGMRSKDKSGSLFAVFYLVAVVLMPIVAALIQVAISRQREYLADASGALAMRDPEGLAQALEKLETAQQPMLRQNSSTSHLFFANPLRSGSLMSRLLSTHPPLEKRIERLRESASKF